MDMALERTRLLQRDAEWAAAASEREFRRALELNPSNAEAHHEYSHYLTAVGRTSESLTKAFGPWSLTRFHYL